MKKSLLLAAIAALAGFSPATLSAKTVYEKVTPTESLEEITDGNYIITCPEHGVVMSNTGFTQSSTFFAKYDLAGFGTTTETIEPNEEYAVVNITKVEGGYHIKYTYGDTEFYLTQAKINQLALTSDEKKATITYEDNKLKIFVNPGFSTTATCYIQYNSANPGLRFAGYKSAQNPITLFKEVEDGGEPEPEPNPIPDDFDRPTLTYNEDLGEKFVHVASIDLVNGTPGGPKLWTSGTSPAFTVTLDDNTSLNPMTDGTLALACNNGTVTITSADPAYYIKGYVYRATSGDGDDIEIEFPIDGELYGPSPDDYGYCYNEEVAENEDVYFIATASRLVISDIDIVFAPVTATEPEPEPEPLPADYTTGLENDHNSYTQSPARNTSALNISDNANHSGSVTNLQTSGNSGAMYFDRAESVAMTTNPGATITITPVENMMWMHKYAYVDWQKDGFLYESPSTYLGGANGYTIKAGSDLVAFDFFSLTGASTGYNSNGSQIDNNPLSTSISFTVPADAEPGIYRVRYKVDWNNVDPKGNQTLKPTGVKNIAGDGGIIVDFTIEIVEPEPEPEPSRHTLVQGEGEMVINMNNFANGTLSADGKTWTSSTTPQFTLTHTGNDMLISNGETLLVGCGNQLTQSATVTISSVDENYYISGFVFDAVGNQGDPVTITYGDHTITTGSEIQYIWIDPIAEGTDAAFSVATTVAGHSKKPIISNFDIRFSPVSPEPEVIPDPSTWTALDRSNWSITGCSQRDGNGDGMFNDIKDGNPNTFWHSNWEQSAYEHSTPHFLVIDLGEGEHAYDGIGYLPRQYNEEGGNGYCNDYAVYVTNDITALSTAGTAANSYTTTGHSSMSAYMASHTPAAEGTMTYTTSNTNRPETRVHFTETKSERYVIFVFKTTANVETGKYHANCAELNLYAFRTEPIPVDHRPAGIEWLDNLAKLTVLYDAAAISAAQEAVNALADDATEEEVMAAAKTVYDNDPAIGKHIRFLNVKPADNENKKFYLAGNDDYMHFSYGEGAESDLTTVWEVVGTDIPGAYRLFNYGMQRYAGYNTTANQHQLWSETGEIFEFFVAPQPDGGCTLEETNQLVFISHNNLNDGTGYVHLSREATHAESSWMVTTWSMASAGTQWRISLAEDNTAEVAGTYDSATGIYTIACADAENPFSHNATRHASHTISLDYQQPLALYAAAAAAESDEAAAGVELTDNGDGTYALDLSEQPKGVYALSIPMGYFATANGFSAAHNNVINHDYTTSITEVNAAAGNAEWYNLQGIRVSAPAKGGIYLRATTTGVEKVIVR